MSCSANRIQVHAILSCMGAFFLSVSTIALESPLQIGFYDSTCPSAEATVWKAVNKAVSQNPGLRLDLLVCISAIVLSGYVLFYSFLAHYFLTRWNIYI